MVRCLAGIRPRGRQTVPQLGSGRNRTGRLMPWLPVAFGAGVVFYFAAAREPILWAAVVLTVRCAAAAVLLRARPIAFPISLALTAMAAGFAVATLKTVIIGHPVLHHIASNVEIAGFVEAREERERSDRIVVRAPSAFAEDCRQAALVVSQRTAPLDCAAQVIDRPKPRANGAVALVRAGDHWTVKVARPRGSGRPRTRLVEPDEIVMLPATIMRPVAGDSTPRGEDVEPGD
jgi:hypothetical protein